MTFIEMWFSGNAVFVRLAGRASEETAIRTAEENLGTLYAGFREIQIDGEGNTLVILDRH